MLNGAGYMGRHKLLPLLQSVLSTGQIPPVLEWEEFRYSIKSKCFIPDHLLSFSYEPY